MGNKQHRVVKRARNQVNTCVEEVGAATVSKLSLGQRGEDWELATDQNSPGGSQVVKSSFTGTVRRTRGQLETVA